MRKLLFLSFLLVLVSFGLSVLITAWSYQSKQSCYDQQSRNQYSGKNRRFWLWARAAAANKNEEPEYEEANAKNLFLFVSHELKTPAEVYTRPRKSKPRSQNPRGSPTLNVLDPARPSAPPGSRCLLVFAGKPSPPSR